MKKKVTLVELSVWERMTPLVSSYLQGYAEQDPAIRDDYVIDRHVGTVAKPVDSICADLIERGSDVYAFSAYAWNVGAVRKVIDGLHQALPSATILVGGPQVAHSAARFIPSEREDIFVCNGEGEPTFLSFLLHHASDRDYLKVEGLSFRRDGQLMTTADAPRLARLDEIPSPYLAGYIETEHYALYLLETTRGCPYRCTFCYWGNGEGKADQVYRFDEHRVRAEIEWIARNRAVMLYIADANWGLLERDLSLTEWIVRCAAKFGAPTMFHAPGAKRTSRGISHRVEQIGRCLIEGGLVSGRSLAFQSLKPEVLVAIERKETPLGFETQRAYNESNIDSQTELVWPLPEETLESFVDGLAILMRSGANEIRTYPLLLLPSTKMDRDRDRLGLATRIASDGRSEYEVVVATRSVDEHDYETGLWIQSCAVMVAHNTRGLVCLGRYLDASGLCRYQDLLRSLVAHFRAHPDSPVTRFIAEGIRKLGCAEYAFGGTIAHLVSFAEREGIDALLHDFAVSQPWWGDPRARLYFELDILSRPCLYSNTPTPAKTVRFEHLKVLSAGRMQYDVAIPEADLPLVIHMRDAALIRGEVATRCRVSYKRTQLPFMKHETLQHNAIYCHGVVGRIRSAMPLWSVP